MKRIDEEKVTHEAYSMCVTPYFLKDQPAAC